MARRRRTQPSLGTILTLRQNFPMTYSSRSNAPESHWNEIAWRYCLTNAQPIRRYTTASAFPEMVDLISGLAIPTAGRGPIERHFQITVEYLARKSCVTKRYHVRISDDPSRLLRVGFREKAADGGGQRGSLGQYSAKKLWPI
jgi:hypothetical protein